MTEKYTFRPGFHGSVDPQIVGEELERIRLNDGVLLTERVVEEATPKTAPLHPEFEWSNKKCGTLYRNQQSRQLIRAVLLDTSEARPQPVFIHVPVIRETPAHYQAAELLARMPDEFSAAMGEALAKLASAKRAVEELSALAAHGQPSTVLSAISSVLNSIKSSRETLKQLQQ
jgi:hypothetical protein